MSPKLFGILAFVAFLMDPCAKRPRAVELKDIAEACKIETHRYFVKVSGKVRDQDIHCGDRPGGRRCEVWLGDGDGRNELRASLRMAVRNNEETRWGSVLIVPETPANVAEPFTVKFTDAQIFNRVGNMVDISKDPLTLSGSLQVDETPLGCSLNVMHVETPDAN